MFQRWLLDIEYVSLCSHSFNNMTDFVIPWTVTGWHPIFCMNSEMPYNLLFPRCSAVIHHGGRWYISWLISRSLTLCKYWELKCFLRFHCDYFLSVEQLLLLCVLEFLRFVFCKWAWLWFTSFCMLCLCVFGMPQFLPT